MTNSEITLSNKILKLERIIQDLQEIIDDQNGVNEKKSSGNMVEIRDHFYGSKWPRNYRHDFDHIRYLTASAFRVKNLSRLDEKELDMAKDFAKELSDYCSELFVKYDQKKKEYIKEKMKKYENIPDR